MVYLFGFALTYALSLVYVNRLKAQRLKPLISRCDGGYIFHPDKLAAIGFFILLIIPLFLISALREGIGTDYYYTYTPRFLEIIEGERTYYEIGFYYFNKLIAVFTHNPQWVFIITSMVFCGFVFTAFEQEGEDLPFCIIILLVSSEYFVSLNNLRQAFASAVILYAYKYVRRKQWLHFGIIVLVMSTIHKSMLIFIPILALFILASYFSTEKILIMISAAAVLGFVLVTAIPELLIAVLPERLRYYIEYSIYTETTIGFVRTAANLAILAFLIFARYKSQSKELDVFIIMQLIAVVICLFDSVVPAAYRILRIVSFWQLLAIPKAVMRFSGKGRIVVKIAVAAALGLLCIYSIVIMGAEEVLPYRSIFS